MSEAAIAYTTTFFALPEETKRKYHQPGTGGARGLTPFGVEAAKGGDWASYYDAQYTSRLAQGAAADESPVEAG